MRGERLTRLTLHYRAEPAEDTQPSDPQDVEFGEIVCSIVPKSGSESEAGDQQKGYEQFTIRARFGPSIAAMDSSWWATRANPATGVSERFNFQSVRNLGERNREIEIDAVRAQ